MIALNHKLKEDTLKLNERLAKANAELQDRLRELRENENKLEATNEALRKNFDHSLELCDRIISVYYPLLGEETRAIVNLCDRMIETGPFPPKAAWLQNGGLAAERRPGCRTAAWLQNGGLAAERRPGCRTAAWLQNGGLAAEHRTHRNLTGTVIQGPQKSRSTFWK